MGPRATVDFERRLLEKLDGSDQQLPSIITINDGSIPDRTAYLLGVGADPLPRISRNALQLQALGADFLCLPCNTACVPAILGRLQPRLRIPVVNLPVEVVAAAKAQGLRKLYLLATTGTVKSKFYERLCYEAGLECIVPQPARQKLISRIIDSVKAGELVAARHLATKLEPAIRSAGCDAVILGCTELPLVQSELTSGGIVALDSLDILAEAAARYTKAKARGVVR